METAFFHNNNFDNYLKSNLHPSTNLQTVTLPFLCKTVNLALCANNSARFVALDLKDIFLCLFFL